MPQTVRMGIIGAGNFSRSRMLPNFISLPDVELVAVANRSLESAEHVAADYGITTALADWKQLLARVDVDAVLVGTQPSAHHEIVLAALRAGKHVLCQTRLASSLQQARQMYKTAQDTGRKAMLVRAAAYSRTHRYVKHLLANGYVGKVRQAFAYYFVPNYVDSSSPLHRRQDHRNFGVINPMALGIYWDALRPWFGDPQRVLASSDIFTPARSDGPNGPQLPIELPDAITVIAQMDGGVVVTCIQSGVAHFGQERIEIYGEEGTLICSPQGDLIGARRGDEALGPLTVPEEYLDSWHVEEDFVRLVRGEITEGDLTFFDGVKNVEYLEASHLSSVEGRWVELPLP